MKTTTAAQEIRHRAGVRFSATLAAFRRAFDPELERWLEAKRRQAAARLPEETDLVDAVRDLVAGGGKRLRPALVIHTHRAAGGREEGAAMAMAMATELLHAYLLIHDDIMDHAEVRRGRPTAHARFRRVHESRGWAGDAADFGRSMAILVGDLAYSYAVELAGRAASGEAGPTPVARPELARSFAEMCQEVIGGQYLEMLLPYRRRASEEDLRRVLQLKSGRYTVERPIELGAILAGAPAAARQVLGRYGVAVGEAFQLSDDVLGAFGDPERVGKPVGGDLIEGKRTFLIHHALATASRAEKAAIEAVLGRADAAPETVERACAALDSSGGRAAVEEMIAERLERAREALDEATTLLPFAADSRSFFAGLLDHLRERDR